jgi:hypothetical protein
MSGVRLSDDELLGGPASPDAPGAPYSDDRAVTEAELARTLGIAPRTVREHARKGIVVRSDGGG